MFINPEFSDQTISIGSMLSRHCKEQLFTLLSNNLDIFAWKPSDMIGVPRSIAEQRLKSYPNVEPIKQKKRGMAPDSLKIVKEEIEKLVKA